MVLTGGIIGRRKAPEPSKRPSLYVPRQRASGDLLRIEAESSAFCYYALTVPWVPLSLLCQLTVIGVKPVTTTLSPCISYVMLPPLISSCTRREHRDLGY